MRARGVLALSACVAACAGDAAGPAPGVPPAIIEATVHANPHNVLSAIVRVRVRHADSAAVLFQLADRPASVERTPAWPVYGDSIEIPVLGLLPEERYAVEVVAWGAGGRADGPALELGTGALPADLPRYTAGGPDPSRGFIVFSANGYGLAIDNSGRVVWYRRLPNGVGLSFLPRAGRYYARPPTPDPTDIEPWVEFDALGNIRRVVTCANGLQPRFHDLIVTSDDSAWLLCDDTRTMDLRAVGGMSAARVTGTNVQRVAATGSLLFEWSPFDHFAIADIAAAELTGPSVNWTHGNALALAADGNLLVSFRNLGEITKIDATTGSVLWRLGGRRNEFTFLGTPSPAFAGQHSVRAYEASSLLLLDNVGDVTESRAERYQLDETARTARLVQALRAVPAALTTIGGSVQELPDGRTLVSFGTAGRVAEYDASGHVVWHIDGHAGYVFRAERIRSLYSPGR